MADNEPRKKKPGRPKKRNPGKQKAANVPGQGLQKSQQEKGRKRKNYLTKKGLCGGFDPGDDSDEGGGSGLDTG